MRDSYHHGELKSALIEAAASIIRESGIEGFSLRQAARRAGVSPSAPSHHFGTAKGLLTEVALNGYETLATYLNQVELSDDLAEDMSAITTRYVQFALDHPGLFRLMFRNDLVDRKDKRYDEASGKAFMGFASLASRFRQERKILDLEDREVLFSLWTAIHGMAHLVLEEKASVLFKTTDSRDFMEKRLPGMLRAFWAQR
nr:TetR/AcrR family transcriptional regulator [uncultured Devosia sp.]